MAITASTPKVDVQTESWIALLGRRDTPTDGVEDYCVYLGRGLAQYDLELKLIRVSWPDGWLGALVKLWREAAKWQGSWVLLQYTSMAWSRRGFPLGALLALAVLRYRRARCAVVFHDPTQQDARGWIRRLRASFQLWVIRRLYQASAKAIFLDPLHKVGWLPADRSKAVFIPIGANIPEGCPESGSKHQKQRAKTVAVFCLSHPPHRDRELKDIARATQILTGQGLTLRLVFLGRGTPEARNEIDRAFRALPVEITNLGLQRADEVRRVLSDSDVMLCVRGQLYPRRGSALAGIACGLPIVAYSGAIEGTPLEEAGIELAPYGDQEELGRALSRVLTDDLRWDTLHARNVQVQRKYFSWERIASSFVQALDASTRS